MPKTLIKTVTAFKFSELSDSSKQKALEKFCDINVDHEWWDCAYEDFKTIGKIIGITIDEIMFSGFSSQGDGACFSGKYEYKRDSVKAIKKYAPTDIVLHTIAENLFKIQVKNSYRIGAKIKHSGHYYHAYCTDIDVFLKDRNGYEDYYTSLTNDTEKIITDTLRDFMNWIYRSLEKEYDYLTSEKVIIETIEANEYDFTEQGNFPAI